MIARLRPMALISLVCASCGDELNVVFAPTEILLRVQSDDDALRENMRELYLELSVQTGDTWDEPRVVSLPAADLKWPVDIPITPSDGALRKPFDVVIEARDEAGDVLAQTRALSGFVIDEQRILSVTLETCGEDAVVCSETSCRGEECQVCIAGQCQGSAAKTAPMLERWDP